MLTHTQIHRNGNYSKKRKQIKLAGAFAFASLRLGQVGNPDAGQFLLIENGSRFVLEDNSGFILLG
jgi:hypothetical protein